MKICKKCNINKSIEEYNKNKRTKDKLHYYCRKCQAILSAKYQKENLEAHKKATERYNLLHQKEIKLYRKMYNKKFKVQLRDKFLQTNYKISLKEYNKILSKQNNKCKLCGKSPKENKRNLIVDHDHKTGQVRDLLCDRCNVGIGLFEENYILLNKVIRYIIKWRKNER